MLQDRALPSLALVELAVLGIWLGGALFFSAAVAPALFAVLPTRSLAGSVVGRLLPVVFIAGIVVGALIVAAGILSDREWNWRGRESAAAVMVFACGFAQLVIVPRIERLRAAIGGPMDALPLSDIRRAAFGRLHGLSVAWLGLAMLAAVVAMIQAGRAVAPKA
jgi:hypothetical protein